MFPKLSKIKIVCTLIWELGIYHNIKALLSTMHGFVYKVEVKEESPRIIFYWRLVLYVKQSLRRNWKMSAIIIPLDCLTDPLLLLLTSLKALKFVSNIKRNIIMSQ